MADEELNLYDEIEIEDCFYDETLQIYHHPCPCGDRFEISIADMRDGEDIARCPSCSLMIRIIFDAVSALRPHPSHSRHTNCFSRTSLQKRRTMRRKPSPSLPRFTHIRILRDPKQSGGIWHPTYPGSGAHRRVLSRYAVNEGFGIFGPAYHGVAFGRRWSVRGSREVERNAGRLAQRCSRI